MRLWIFLVESWVRILHAEYIVTSMCHLTTNTKLFRIIFADQYSDSAPQTKRNANKMFAATKCKKHSKSRQNGCKGKNILAK